MEEKNVYCKPAYKCGICGKKHDNVISRANCELACHKKKEEDEKRAAAEKKLAEKKLRKEAVDEAVMNAFRLTSAFIKDYGSYEYGEDIVQDCILPNRIWHYFG